MAKELLVFTTVPDEETAENISQYLVETRLAACVTRTAICKSIYWWKGKITKDNEHILFIKTQAKRYPELEKALVKIHPYEVPEVIAVPLIQGFGKYLNWLNEETDPGK
ncbi:divalent-cation tolerance protein CutA [Acidobacteriota bacterium]